jgi:hypothetical protein
LLPEQVDEQSRPLAIVGSSFHDVPPHPLTRRRRVGAG